MKPPKYKLEILGDLDHTITTEDLKEICALTEKIREVITKSTKLETSVKLKYFSILK